MLFRVSILSPPAVFRWVCSFWYFLPLIVGILVYIGEINISPLDPNGDPIKRIVYLVLIVVAGLIGGILFAIFWRIGLFAVGALGGFFGAMFALAFLPPNILPDPIWRALIIVIATIICAFLVFKFERPVVIIATAIMGAFLAVLGVDCFARTQFAAAMAAFLSASGRYNPDARTYGMLAGVAVMAVLGMIVQFTLFKGLFRRDKSAANTSNRSDNV